MSSSTGRLSVITSLQDCRVVIVGLGLMGGSLALALRGRVRALSAVDPDPATRDLALRNAVVDRVSNNPAELLPDSDMVVLAAPVGVILGLIPALPDWHPGHPVVLDLGSTKTAICKALERLPARFDPLGGHPMAGKEVGGLRNATTDLYRDAPFALTPLDRTSARARGLAAELVEIIGARPLWLDPQTHDRWTAASSHLPYLVAQALTRATPFEAAPLVGSGFRSTTRLAESPLTMMGDVLKTNQRFILSALRRLQAELETLQHELEAGPGPMLGQVLEAGQARRRLLTGGWIPAPEPPPAYLKEADFVLRPLTVDLNELDFAAMCDRRQSPAPPGYSLADNLVAVQAHAADHAARRTFTFSVLDLTESEVLGCVYLYPLASLLNRARAGEELYRDLTGHEVAVHFWVRDRELQSGLLENLLDSLYGWLCLEWGFDPHLLFFHTGADDRRQITLYESQGFAYNFNLDLAFGRFYCPPEAGS